MRLFLKLIPFAASILALLPQVAGAQNVSPLDNAPLDSGWQIDPYGMRHYTGLVCRDRLGMLTRVKVLPGGMDTIAGCIYTTPQGIHAALRSHAKGASAGVATNFAKRFSDSGFKRVKTTGATASGLTFATGERETGTRCETLWRFAGKERDYTLWMAYTLPVQESEIGPIVATIIEEIAKRD
ncbi:hypothetical protein HPQ64_09865 [Rhizobiales bacterium]|uniref:hypothetical protein n=1 Tax=Hongsoonwoonella zoysiae TaxID=2821844 RepID=UPI0015615F07|nr:hypothetical protein [Hongsoonwoonella zoysiae]NRG17993.1 hypothetical protein [Hongsoonwoonella zoysiae]